jgi:hypothetical protein
LKLLPYCQVIKKGTPAIMPSQQSSNDLAGLCAADETIPFVAQQEFLQLTGGVTGVQPNAWCIAPELEAFRNIICLQRANCIDGSLGLVQSFSS